MNFYLETTSQQAVLDIGQYIPLFGVLVPAESLSKEEANVKGVLDSLVEAMPENAELLVSLMPSNFRRMLAEARDLKNMYPNLVPMFPADPQSYMAIKACRTAKIPAAISHILYLEQAWFANSSGAAKIVLDFKAASALSDPVALLNNLKPLYDKLLVCHFSDPGEVRLCMMLGVEHIGLSEELCHTLLENPASRALAAGMREEWIMAYTRDTVLDASDH